MPTLSYCVCVKVFIRASMSKVTTTKEIDICRSRAHSLTQFISFWSTHLPEKRRENTVRVLFSLLLLSRLDKQSSACSSSINSLPRLDASTFGAFVGLLCFILLSHIHTWQYFQVAQKQMKWKRFDRWTTAKYIINIIKHEEKKLKMMARQLNTR